MKLFNKIAYHSTTQKGLDKFDDSTSKEKAYTGEGAQVHGWGLYLQADKEINIRRYKNELSSFQSYNCDLIDVITKNIGVNFPNNPECKSWNSLRFQPLYIKTDDYYETDNGWFRVEYDDKWIRFSKAMNEFKDNLYILNKDVLDELLKLKDNAKIFLNELSKFSYTLGFKPSDILDVMDRIMYINVELSIVCIKNASQYTVEIPDDFKFLDEHSINLQDPLIDKIMKDNGFGTDVDSQKLKEDLKKTIYDVYPKIPYLDNIIDDYIVYGSYMSHEEFINQVSPEDVGITFGDKAIDNYERMERVFYYISQHIYDSEYYHFMRFSIGSGKELYTELANKLGGQEEASKYLASVGIDGISYNGGTDGECYVIFDCSKLKIISEE